MTITAITPNHTITLTRDGTTLTTNPSTITSDSSGSFSATFAVPSSADGSHKVTATDGTNRHSALFAVGASTTAPQPPTGLTAGTISSSQINLSWTAGNNGGSAIIGYEIERSTNGGSTWSTIQSNTGNTATTYSDTGLTSSTTYTYRVSAINAVGTSQPSNTASATTSSSTCSTCKLTVTTQVT